MKGKADILSDHSKIEAALEKNPFGNPVGTLELPSISA